MEKMVLISYYVIVSVILIFIVATILSNCNLILKNNSLGHFLRSPVFKFIMKKFLYSIVSFLFIMIVLFFLIRLISVNNFNDSYSLSEFDNPIYNSSNIFEDLKNYFYNLLPFPKKVCVATNLNDNGIYCSNYEYKIINFGYSSAYMKNTSVWQIIKEKVPVSFLIGFIAYVLECLMGYPLGIYMARKRNGFLDKSVTLFHTISISFPTIILLYSFLIIFMAGFNLPVTFEIDNLLSYIAPLSSVVFLGSLSVAYWVKRYLLLELDKDYVKLATSKGLDESYIFYKHIFRNALQPLLRTIPTSLFACLCGYYLLELTFNIPGIGLTLVTAINLNDVYLIQGLILFFSFFSVTSYFLGDVIAVILNRRIVQRKEVTNDEK